MSTIMKLECNLDNRGVRSLEIESKIGLFVLNVQHPMNPENFQDLRTGSNLSCCKCVPEILLPT